MGNKVHARALANECGVPIIPGTEMAVEATDDAFAFAERLFSHCPSIHDHHPPTHGVCLVRALLIITLEDSHIRS